MWRQRRRLYYCQTQSAQRGELYKYNCIYTGAWILAISALFGCAFKNYEMTGGAMIFHLLCAAAEMRNAKGKHSTAGGQAGALRKLKGGKAVGKSWPCFAGCCLFGALALVSPSSSSSPSSSATDNDGGRLMPFVLPPKMSTPIYTIYIHRHTHTFGFHP